jgi:hypothetical protein
MNTNKKEIIEINKNMIIDKHIEEQVEIGIEYFKNCPHKNDVNDLINQMLDKYFEFNLIFEGQEDKLKIFTFNKILNILRNK